MSPRVVVFDYGSGNVHSALKALEAAGAEVTLTNDATVAREAEGLVVPGVGAFATVMSALKAVGGDSLIEKRLAGSRPVLGICVGLQVMCEGGVEHGVSTEGLGQWPGIVEKLEAAILPQELEHGTLRDAPSAIGDLVSPRSRLCGSGGKWTTERHPIPPRKIWPRWHPPLAQLGDISRGCLTWTD